MFVLTQPTSKGVMREVIMVGDSNLARFIVFSRRRSWIKECGNPTEPKATIAEAHDMIIKCTSSKLSLSLACMCCTLGLIIFCGALNRTKSLTSCGRDVTRMQKNWWRQTEAKPYTPQLWWPMQRSRGCVKIYELTIFSWPGKWVLRDAWPEMN